jgi:hypothetical protein
MPLSITIAFTETLTPSPRTVKTEGTTFACDLYEAMKSKLQDEADVTITEKQCFALTGCRDSGDR